MDIIAMIKNNDNTNVDIGTCLSIRGVNMSKTVFYVIGYYVIIYYVGCVSYSYSNMASVIHIMLDTCTSV